MEPGGVYDVYTWSAFSPSSTGAAQISRISTIGQQTLLFLRQQNVNQEYEGKLADQTPDVITLNVPSSSLPQLTLRNALHRTKVWPRFWIVLIILKPAEGWRRPKDWDYLFVVQSLKFKLRRKVGIGLAWLETTHHHHQPLSKDYVAERTDFFHRYPRVSPGKTCWGPPPLLQRFSNPISHSCSVNENKCPAKFAVNATVRGKKQRNKTASGNRIDIFTFFTPLTFPLLARKPIVNQSGRLISDRTIWIRNQRESWSNSGTREIYLLLVQWTFLSRC